MPRQLTDAELQTSFLYFARDILGLNKESGKEPYGWQDKVWEPFDHASTKLVQVTLSTPNGAGKSSVLIPVLVLGWLYFYEKGRIALTTADGTQLDMQVMPALNSFAHLFPSWKFIERYIETPTGGFFFARTANDPSRVEGAHKLDDRQGPLLAIVDEAKSVTDDIFMGIDRWTYNAILLTSSPGEMRGRFYDSHYSTPGFVRVKAGLADCPHIKPDKIKRLMDVHGPDGTRPNPSFLASALHGEFMESEGEMRFDRTGLDYLKAIAELGHPLARRAVLQQQTWLQHGQPATTITTAGDGWIWMSEEPIPSCRYIGFCDPMTGEQSEGSTERDTHAAGILRAPYIDSNRVEHDLELVAAIYVPDSKEPSGAACRWDNDVLADRFAMLLRFYGNCLAIVEANNSGTEVIRLLLMAGCNLWRREKPNHRVPGRKMVDVVGFQTTSSSKNYLIGAIGGNIREQSLVCKFKPATKQCSTFILNEKGTGEAQNGCHDDWVVGLGLGAYQIHAATEMPGHAIIPALSPVFGMTVFDRGQTAQTSHGACS